jgi:hypothetical protein
METTDPDERDAADARGNVGRPEGGVAMKMIEVPACWAPECHRPVRARGLCQTHYNQHRHTGRLEPIRPQRRPRRGTNTRLSGHVLTCECAAAVSSYAKDRGLAVNAVITDVLEAWARRRRKKRRVERQSCNPAGR